VGKTTTCTNLAAATARVGSRVLLLDADPLSAIGAALNLAQHPRRQALRQAGIDLPGVIVSDIIPGLDLISPYEEGTCSDQELGEVLELISSSGNDHYSCMIVDTPPFMGADPVRLLNVCDEFVVIMRAEPLAYRTLPAFLELVQRSKKPDRNLQMQGILLTLPEGEPFGGRWECELRGRFGSRILPQVIPFDEEVGRALQANQIVSLYSPDCSAAMQYQALAEHLVLNTQPVLVGSHAQETPLRAMAASFQAQAAAGGTGSFGESNSSTALLTGPIPEESDKPVGIDTVTLAESHTVPRKTPVAEKAPPPLTEEPDLETPTLPEPEIEAIAPPKRRIESAPPTSRPRRVQPEAPKRPVVPAPAPAKAPSRQVKAQPTPPAASSPFPAWIVWIGLAVIIGVSLRFVPLPSYMLPIVVGLSVAGGVVLAVLLGLPSGDQPAAPAKPKSRQTARPARVERKRVAAPASTEQRTGQTPVSTPTPAPRPTPENPGKKDPISRLAALANRANRRKPPTR
jgi:chromosome partitioning protein